MLNKVMLIGNLGRDPEMRRTAGGQAVANFSVATSRKWKDRDGNRQEQTEWHNIVAWGRQAEVAGQYLGKGSRVYVEGRLQTRSWDDRNTGEKKYRTEIVMDHLQMLSFREESRPQGYGHSAESRMGDGSTHPAEGADYDDDIPFMLPFFFGLWGIWEVAHEAVLPLSQMVV